MSRPRWNRPLNVFQNSRLVGRLSQQSSGAIDFQYAPSWLGWEHAMPVSLSLPLREDRYIGAPVVAVFDNLLPDSTAIRRRVAERVHAEGTSAFDLLAAVGRDCVGALQFLPDDIDPGPAGAVNGKPVDEKEIARIINDLALAPLGLSEDEDFRISLAGAQEKTALLFLDGQWMKPTGATATTHILKPLIGWPPNGIDLSKSVENEFLCLRMVAAFGLPTAGVRIEEFEGVKVLIVERFDRLWTRDARLLRLPQEDCCQALSVPPSLKYEPDGGPGIAAILELLKASDQPGADQRQFIKAVVAFWLLGATDGHAKNFSVFLSPGGRFRLTPLYDVISTQPNLDAGQISRNRMKLAMAVGDHHHYKLDSIMPRHFVETAAKAGVGAAVVHSVFEDLCARALPAIDEITASLPPDFPHEVADSIAGGIRERLRRLESA